MRFYKSLTYKQLPSKTEVDNTKGEITQFLTDKIAVFDNIYIRVDRTDCLCILFKKTNKT